MYTRSLKYNLLCLKINVCHHVLVIKYKIFTVVAAVASAAAVAVAAASAVAAAVAALNVLKIKLR